MYNVPLNFLPDQSGVNLPESWNDSFSWRNTQVCWSWRDNLL